MDPVAQTIGLGWLALGLVSVALAIPLLRGWVKRNALYGVRFPQSFQSDAAWQAINRYGARLLLWWSLPLVFGGIACLFLPLQAHPGVAMMLGFAPLAFVLIPYVLAWRFARHYGKNA
jgi:uncharacterized membrane protein